MEHGQTIIYVLPVILVAEPAQMPVQIIVCHVKIYLIKYFIRYQKNKFVKGPNFTFL
jgi:hypothetical protein